MENIKFLGAANEVQKIYNDLGLLVPVGDLSTSKAPGFKVYEVKYNEDGEDSAVNATIQIYCNSEGSGVYALYKTSDIEELFPDGVPTDYDLDEAINNPDSPDPIQGKTQYAYSDIPFRKDMYVLSMPTNNADYTSAVLPYDDYTLIMSVGSYSGGVTTVTSQFSAVAPPNWATADEVLEGNKYIGEDGQEHTGEYEVPVTVLETVSVTPTTSSQTITPSTGYDGIGTANVSAVTSSIDSNIQAENIKKDVEILGVTGTFEGGPTDGDSVVTSATLEYQIIQDPDAGDILDAIIRVNFDTFPEMDFENHKYMATLYADSPESYCQDSDPIGCRLSFVECGYNMVIGSYILEDGYIELYGNTYPVEVDPNAGTITPLAEVDAYLVIYEDKIWNQKYIISFTLTCSQITEP